MTHALVTGTSREIGRAVVSNLAARAVQVALHHQSDRAAAEQTRRALAGDGHVLLAAEPTALPDAASYTRTWNEHR